MDSPLDFVKGLFNLGAVALGRASERRKQAVRAGAPSAAYIYCALLEAFRRRAREAYGLVVRRVFAGAATVFLKERKSQKF